MTLKYSAISVTVLAVLALVACAPVTILNGITPSSSFNKTENVSFGPGERDVMDMYRADKPKEDAPILIFVHGGSWDSGSKDIYKFLAEGFTKSGYDVAVPNYTLYPEAKFPNFLDDNARAVKAVTERFPDKPIVMMGHSAGGYNVLMLALRDEYLKRAGVERCAKIAGVVGLAAPTGIVPLESARLIEIFPDRFTGRDAVLNNVSGPSPALFLGHGEADTTVYPRNSRALADKVSARGGLAVVEIYPKQSHTDVVKVLSRHFDGDVNLKSDIVKFIDSLPKSGNFCQ